MINRPMHSHCSGVKSKVGKWKYTLVNLFIQWPFVVMRWNLTAWCTNGDVQIALVWRLSSTVYPKKYAHGFVVLCFVVVIQSFIMNSHEVFIHIHQGCFADTGAIVRLPQCQWSKPDGYGKISQCITTAKHSKAKTVCIFLGIYCTRSHQQVNVPRNCRLPTITLGVIIWKLVPTAIR